MKELDVKKVSMANIPVESVPALLDEEKVAFQPVNTVNWAAYPYCPDVKFRMAYADNAILIHYKVKENSIRAVAGRDNGPVWEDSCVEFFSVPAEDGVYYNMECNCAGRLLIGAGALPPLFLQNPHTYLSIRNSRPLQLQPDFLSYHRFRPAL